VTLPSVIWKNTSKPKFVRGNRRPEPIARLIRFEVKGIADGRATVVLARGIENQFLSPGKQALSLPRIRPRVQVSRPFLPNSRKVNATDAPSEASRRTMPAPMPFDPAVTRATLPVNDFSCTAAMNILQSSSLAPNSTHFLWKLKRIRPSIGWTVIRDRHSEILPTMWSLSNAFTRAFKKAQSSPTVQGHSQARWFSFTAAELTRDLRFNLTRRRRSRFLFTSSSAD
jgi:hypothetical protein